MRGNWIIFRMGTRYPELHETLELFVFAGAAGKERAKAEAEASLAAWRDRQPHRVFALGLEEHA